MMLDTGLTLEETIEEMRAERARLGPTFEFCCSNCVVGFLNIFGAMK